MVKMKKSSSDRVMRSTPDSESRRSQLVYRQSSLQAIGAAPEPSTRPIMNRHAVSALDLMNQSLTGMSDSASIRSDSRPRSQSFTLQGSASSLLKGGINAVRRNTTMSAMSNSNASPRSDKDGVLKRSIYAPKELEAVRSGLEGLKLGDSDDGTDHVDIDVIDPVSDDESSDDSYDANILGIGMDAAEGSMRKLSKQGSSLSGRGGMLGSVADYSAESDEYEDEDDFPASVSSFDEYDGHVTCCGFHAPQCRLPINRIASAIVRYAPCFWCFPIPISATDRTVLTRLNIMSAFLTTGQVISTSWLIIVMLIPPSDHEQGTSYSLTHGMAPNLWSLTGSMYSIGFFGKFVLCYVVLCDGFHPIALLKKLTHADIDRWSHICHKFGYA